ncbi:MAG: hypothetical protein H6753_05475 [Candidatus Omnitrophica bacterium]|nr:hypothetical protein [Candidatus Omnitrophota bacterium]
MSVENTQMPDPKQLPYLLNLLDDESAEIRAQIVKHLTAFGSTLKDELAKLPPEIVQTRTIALEKILLKYDRETLLQGWSSWAEQTLDLEKLETALSLLAQFQSGLKFQYATQNVSVLLNNLATEYLAFAQENNALELAKFLFEVKGYTGAKTDYYNPQCSNLLYVLNEKRGLPISLSCVYILVGARLGFVIEGYNFPGHFMAKVFVKSKGLLIDCFNGGKILQEKEILHSGPVINEHDSSSAKAVDIVRRVLNNLINAYQAQGENDHQQLMIELYRTIQDPST